MGGASPPSQALECKTSGFHEGVCGFSHFPLLQQAELCLPSWLPVLHLGALTKFILQARLSLISVPLVLSGLA